MRTIMAITLLFLATPALTSTPETTLAERSPDDPDCPESAGRPRADGFEQYGDYASARRRFYMLTVDQTGAQQLVDLAKWMLVCEAYYSAKRDEAARISFIEEADYLIPLLDAREDILITNHHVAMHRAALRALTDPADFPASVRDECPEMLREVVRRQTRCFEGHCRPGQALSEGREARIQAERIE